MLFHLHALDGCFILACQQNNHLVKQVIRKNQCKEKKPLQAPCEGVKAVES